MSTMTTTHTRTFVLLVIYSLFFFVFGILFPLLNSRSKRSVSLKKTIRHGFQPETHIKRKATWHDCLPRFLGNGDNLKWNSVRWGKKYFVLGWLYRHGKPNEPITKGEPLSFVLHESPFASVQQSAGATPLWSLWFQITVCSLSGWCARVLHVLNLIWFGYIARLSQ